jgi:hypothetical protein
MYLHKTTANVPASKSAPEPSTKNVSSKTPPAQTAKTSAPSLPPVPRSVSSLISSAGLPADKLSASIISFARFFSLPIKPETMAAIRRQALAQSSATAQSDAAKSATTQSDLARSTAAGTVSDTGVGVKGREAFSLAAAAAESKGVELNPKGIEMFAEAIDPDQRGERGQDQRGRRNRNRDEREEGASLKTGSLSASGVEEIALETAGNDPLLCVLNRMPGKNGQRWVVLPFNFSENGRDFRVSMRILLEAERAANRAVCMALDIGEYGESGAEKRRLFVLEPAGRLSVYLQAELPPGEQASLVGELSALLEIPPERVSVKKWAVSFPCESGDQMRFIDEAV